jgi:NAD+ kinase
MKIGYYIKKTVLKGDARIKAVLDRISEGGSVVYDIESCPGVDAGTDLVLSFGGDGTFLTAAHLVAETGVPVLGVNFGRMGFLAGNMEEDVAAAVLASGWTVEDMDLLEIDCGGLEIPGFWPYAVNELSLHRDTAEMLGVDVSVDGNPLPTYWADGLLVATSAGSTAYSLSAGGPICLPGSKVKMITPVAPHNLNLRPLVVPGSSRIELTGKSRSGRMLMSLDNRNYSIPSTARLTVSTAPFALRRASLRSSNFIEALKSRFFWGQDVRNNG